MPKYYITKSVLKKGIYAVIADEPATNILHPPITIKSPRSEWHDIQIPYGDYHATLESAISEAEHRRKKQISRLEAQLKELYDMKFNNISEGRFTLCSHCQSNNVWCMADASNDSNWICQPCTTKVTRKRKRF